MEEFLYKLVPRGGMGGAGEDRDPGVEEVWSFSSCLNLAKGDITLDLPAGAGLVGLLGEVGEEGFEF